MRVIAGSARGHNLKGPRSDATRPTSDMVRGALFAMLESMLELETGLEGLRVLDLYAGTGALGIEALSRGAAWCDFVEEDRASCRIIAENLAHTRLGGLASVHCHTVERVLAHPEILGGKGRSKPDAVTPVTPDHCTQAPEYDIILLDPPYALAEDPRGGLWGIIGRLADSGYAAPGGLVVLEHSRRATAPESLGRLSLVRSRRHGDTCVAIYAVGEAPADALPAAA